MASIESQLKFTTFLKIDVKSYKSTLPNYKILELQKHAENLQRENNIKCIIIYKNYIVQTLKSLKVIDDRDLFRIYNSSEKNYFYPMNYLNTQVKPFFDIDKCSLTHTELYTMLQDIMKEYYGVGEYKIYIGGYLKKTNQYSYRPIIVNCKINFLTFAEDMEFIKYKVKDKLNDIDLCVYSQSQTVRHVMSYKSNEKSDYKTDNNINTKFNLYYCDDSFETFKACIINYIEDQREINMLLSRKEIQDFIFSKKQKERKINKTNKIIKIVNSFQLDTRNPQSTNINLNLLSILIKSVYREMQIGLNKLFEDTYSVKNIDWQFDTSTGTFLLEHPWKNGASYKCLCKNPDCILIGNSRAAFNYFNSRDFTLCNLNTNKTTCKSFINITEQMKLYIDIKSRKYDKFFSEFSTQDFLYKQKIYLDEMYSKISVTDQIHITDIRNQIVNLDYKKYHTHVQIGPPGAVKTQNFVSFFQQYHNEYKGIKKYIVIIVSLVLQNNDMLNKFLKVYNSLFYDEYNKCYENDDIRITPCIHSEDSDISLNKLNQFKNDNKHDIIIVNAKSISDIASLGPDVLFCDEFIQILTSVSDVKEYRNKSLSDIFYNLIRNSKLLFINDIVVDPSLFDLLKTLNQTNNPDRLCLHRYSDSYMKFKKIHISKDIKLLCNLLETEDKLFIYSDSKMLIEVIVNKIKLINQKRKIERSIIKIIGKHMLQSKVARKIEITNKINEEITKDVDIIIVSPAIQGAISIYGKRKTIIIKMYSFISYCTALNAGYRARESEELYFFDLQKNFNIDNLQDEIQHDNNPMNYSLNYQNKLNNMTLKPAFYMIGDVYGTNKNVGNLGYAVEIIHQNINCNIKEDFKKYLNFEVNKKPKSSLSIWNSNVFGLNLLYTTELEKMICWVRGPMPNPDGFKFSNLIKGLRFKFNSVKYYYKDWFELKKDFANYNFLETENNNYDESIILDEQYTEQQIELFKPRFEFFNKFFSLIKNLTEFQSKIKMHVPCFSTTQIQTEEDFHNKKYIKINEHISVQFDELKMLEKQYAKYKHENNLDLMVKYIIACLKVKHKNHNIKVGRRIVSVFKIINNQRIKVKDIADYDNIIIQNLTKDKYEDQEIRSWNLPMTSCILGKLIHYEYKSKHTRVNKKIVRKQTLERLTCDQIEMHIFFDNDIVVEYDIFTSDEEN